MDHDHVDPTSVPKWILPPFLVCEKRLSDESLYIHLAMQGLHQLRQMPSVLKVLHGGEQCGEDQELIKRMDSAMQDAEWVEAEAASGFPLLHAHSVVGIWSAVEVMTEDFALVWLENVPSAWQVQEVAKIKLPISRLRQLGPLDQPAIVIAELTRSFTPEIRRGAGQLKALLGVFNLWPTIGPNLQKGLHELCQVRNVLVHCAGKADQKFVEDCSWFGVDVGTIIKIPHPLYAWYFHIARRFAERVLNQAMLSLGFQGCNCPGMDEVHERPQ